VAIIIAMVLASAGASTGQQSTPARPASPALAQPAPPSTDTFNRLAARVDPYVDKTRVLVLTDIANEPDDQMSMVRFLVYSDGFDVEGLVATTSTWLRKGPRPDVIHKVIDAYEQVQPRLLEHAPGFPVAADLRKLVTTGQPSYGMDAVGTDKMTPGADLIIRAADKADPRPLWVLAWGGANTLAQALHHVREARTPADAETFVSRLRVYTISDQDDAGPWIRREFPTLHYIAVPSTPNGEQYYLATWTGISGDRYYRNGDGADFTTFTDEWIDANIRGRAPLGTLYIPPCCIHEGDTPSFLGLIQNGLASFMNPTYGGWGGRYMWRQPYGETRPSWTQGGDSFPGRPSSRDTVIGADGKPYTSDQATIWRWRTAFQHDFAARMDWTVKGARDANHNPDVVVNGAAGKAPLVIDARVGQMVTLDATGSSDRDGHPLNLLWFFYPEAGGGIPGAGGPRPPGAGEGADAGGGAAAGGGAPASGQRAGGPLPASLIPSAPPGVRPLPVPRVTVFNEHSFRATVMPNSPGTAHVILAVTDSGTPSLTSYRRVILNIQPAAAPR
jgi:hypothetical protein